MVAVALVGALGFMASACDVPPDGAGAPGAAKDDAEQVRSALNETFSTLPSDANPVVAAANDRVFAVWLAHTSGGVNVVGQMFTADGKALPQTPSPVVYTTTSHAKSSVAVAWDGGQRFLVAYQDTYTPGVDDDILAFSTDLYGNPVAMTSMINYTSNFDFQPTITFDKSINKFVVAYLERVTTFTNRILGNTVDLTQPTYNQVAGPFTYTPTAAAQASVKIASGNGLVALTWRGNDLGITANNFMFVPGSSPLTAGTIQTVTTDGSASAPSVAFSPLISEFALAWTQGTPTGYSSVHMRGFPPGCSSLACAFAEKDSIRGFGNPSAADPSLNAPVIVGNDYGYYLFAGLNNGPYYSTPRTATFFWIDDHGYVGGANLTAIPGCNGPQPTTPLVTAGATMGDNETSFVSIISYCSGTNLGVVEGLSVAPGVGGTAFTTKPFKMSN
jgi:hypothetical protein